MDQITIPQSYREYFSSEKKEILGDDKGKVYYVFKNVYTPVKCGILLCTAGDGILEKTFFSYSDARKFVKGQEIIKIENDNAATLYDKIINVALKQILVFSEELQNNEGNIQRTIQDKNEGNSWRKRGKSDVSDNDNWI